MSNILRATVFLIAGLCWFAAALFFAVFAWSYIAGGAGLQFFGLSFSSGTLLLGLIHLLGFSFGAFLCFAIGVGLCAHGIVPPSQTEARRRIQPLVFIRELWARRSAPQEPGLCCVRCAAGFTASVHICPECGWTQPLTTRPNEGAAPNAGGRRLLAVRASLAARVGEL